MRYKGWKLGWLAVVMGGLIVGYGSVSSVSLKAEDSSVGIVTQLSGNAWIIGGTGELIPIYKGMNLPLGIKFKCEGGLVIKFADSSILSVNPGSVVEILGNGQLWVREGSAEFTTPEVEFLVLEPDGRVVNVRRTLTTPFELSPTTSGIQLKISPIFPSSSGGSPEPVEPASPSS